MKYEYFLFLPDWWSVIKTLPQEQGTRLIKQVACYGLYEYTPESLTGVAAEYFLQVIRPDLDRQHAAYRRKNVCTFQK